MRKLTAKQFNSVEPTNHFPGLTAVQLRETAEGGDVAKVVEEILFRQHRAEEAGHKLRYPSRKLLEELVPKAQQAKPEPKAPKSMKDVADNAAAKPKAKQPVKQAKHPKNYNAALGMVRSLLANADCGDDFRKDVEALLKS